MKKTSHLLRPQVTIDDIEFLNAALKAVLPVVDPAEIPVDFRVRFTKTRMPFESGDETSFSLHAAVKALEAQHAEFVTTVPADIGRAA